MNIDETLALRPDKRHGESNQPIIPSIGIIWHPDQSRVGSIAPLFLGKQQEAELSRDSLLFYADAECAGMPLMDRHVSRKPLLIRRVSDTGYEITPPASRMSVVVNGQPIYSTAEFSLTDLGCEIIISLSDEIVLAIYECPAQRPPSPEKYGLLGISSHIQDIWRAVERVGPTDFHVLLRGETGTGKELIAQALHSLSSQRAHSMLNINMATLSSELAAAELFGTARGAFTGANQDKAGLFEQATRGTLFLDEIGDTPRTVQSMLLRTLETGEIRRVGETKVKHSNARVIAATDRPLTTDNFSQPLLRRLENIVITAPNLRNRRVDIGILIKHFSNDSELFRVQAPRFGLSVARLAHYDWPGNVRELRNVVQQITLGQTPDILKEHVGHSSAQAHQQARPSSAVLQEKRIPYRSPKSVSEKEMLEALDGNQWYIKHTAQYLNISRTTLYSLMEKSTTVRRSEDLSEHEIEQVTANYPDDLDYWAKELRVPRNALKRRVKQSFQV